MELYRHSGKIGLAGPLLVTLCGSLTAVVLGVVYSYFIVYVPLIYLNFVANAVFGFAIGGAVGWAAKSGRSCCPTC